MLAMLDYCEAVESGSTLDPRKSRRRVVGIDIDIRSHNRSAIEAHPLAGLISMVEGSSVDGHVIDEVHQLAASHETVMVFMDSNHTHEHVLGELNAYAHLVTKGSYCVVFDTFVEDMPPKYFPDRPWDKGDSPKTAVREYLKSHSEFEIDKSIDNKLLISVAPDAPLTEAGFLAADKLATSDRMELFVFADEASSQFVLTARFDNLGKGAAGAAVQNMNLMLGLNPLEGLNLS